MQYIAMAWAPFYVNMTSCTFYEYSLHGALRSLGCEGDGRSLGVRVKGGV